MSFVYDDFKKTYAKRQKNYKVAEIAIAQAAVRVFCVTLGTTGRNPGSKERNY